MQNTHVYLVEMHVKEKKEGWRGSGMGRVWTGDSVLPGISFTVIFSGYDVFKQLSARHSTGQREDICTTVIHSSVCVLTLAELYTAL